MRSKSNTRANLRSEASRTWYEMFSEFLTKHLLPYQQEWLKNQSRLKIGTKARQTGFSFIIGVEAVLSAYFDHCDQVIISASERQAVEDLEKCSRASRLFESFPSEKDSLPARVVAESKSELRYSNGCKILSLPQNPDTVRGFTGNVYLDEFAHYREDNEIYEAIYPTITKGHKLRIVSTPMGQSGLFYEIWSNREKYPDFWPFKLDIYQAREEGLNVDVSEIRRNFDEESFRQEYLCEFVDETSSYFPYALLRSCVGEETGTGGTHYLGVDIGRKRDLTVLYILSKLGDKLYTKRIEELAGVDFETQRLVISQIIRDENIQRGCIDASGIGMQLAEELKQEFAFIEPVIFTNDTKERLVVLTKRKFEEKLIQTPDNSKLIADCHAIKKIVTASNNIRFDAVRSAIGHADRFWALAMAVEAAENYVEAAMSEQYEDEDVMSFYHAERRRTW